MTNTNTTTEKVKKVKIKIPLTKTEKEDYWVSVNGEKYQIKRGEYVEVPEYIAAAVEHSEKMMAEAMHFEEQAQK